LWPTGRRERNKNMTSDYIIEQVTKLLIDIKAHETRITALEAIEKKGLNK
jgi:hypothetical protein